MSKFTRYIKKRKLMHHTTIACNPQHFRLLLFLLIRDFTEFIVACKNWMQQCAKNSMTMLASLTRNIKNKIKSIEGKHRPTIKSIIILLSFW